MKSSDVASQVHFWRQHPLSECQFRVLAALLPLHLPASAPGKAKEDASLAWAPFTNMGDQGMEFLVPSSSWPRPDYWSYMGSEPKDGRCLPLSGCPSPFQIKKINKKNLCWLIDSDSTSSWQDCSTIPLIWRYWEYKFTTQIMVRPKALLKNCLLELIQVEILRETFQSVQC